MAEMRINDRVSLRRSRLDDCVEIAYRARQADIDEVFALNHMTILEALAFSHRFSDYSFTATLDGHPALMTGVGETSVLTGVASPWMLGTDDIDRHPILFWKASRDFVMDLSRRYTILRNHVDDRHTQSKRWLTRLGFTFGPATPMGYEGRPFRTFELRRSV